MLNICNILTQLAFLKLYIKVISDEFFCSLWYISVTNLTYSWSLLTRRATVFAKSNALTGLHRIKSRIFSFIVLKSRTCINPMSIKYSKNLHAVISLTMEHGIFQFVFGKLKSPQIITLYLSSSQMLSFKIFRCSFPFVSVSLFLFLSLSLLPSLYLSKDIYLYLSLFLCLSLCSSIIILHGLISWNFYYYNSILFAKSLFCLNWEANWHNFVHFVPFKFCILDRFSCNLI